MAQNAPSRREVEAFAATVSGLAYPEIATRLGVGTKRVSYLVTRVRDLLGARTLPQAALMAVAAGWLDVEDTDDGLVVPAYGPFRSVNPLRDLTEQHHAYLRAFDRLLAGERSAAADQAVDEVFAVVRFTDQYGFVPRRGQRNGTHE